MCVLQTRNDPLEPANRYKMTTTTTFVYVFPEDLYWRHAINHTLPTVTCGWTGNARNLFSAQISKLIRQLFTFIYELRIGNSTPRRYQSSHLSVSGGNYGPYEFGTGICIFSVSRRTWIVRNEIVVGSLDKCCVCLLMVGLAQIPSTDVRLF